VIFAQLLYKNSISIGVSICLFVDIYISLKKSPIFKDKDKDKDKSGHIALSSKFNKGSVPIESVLFCISMFGKSITINYVPEIAIHISVR
jgi:hypothetical protein